MKGLILLLALLFSLSALARPVSCDGGDPDEKVALKITIDSDPSTTLSTFTIYESDEAGTFGPLFGKGQLLEKLLPGENVKTTLTLASGETLKFQTARGMESFEGAFGLNIDGKDKMLYFMCFENWAE